MKPSNEALLQEIMADFEKTRDTFLEVQRNLTALHASAESPDRTVTATVDARGQLSSLTFRGAAHRDMPGPQLADLIVSTVRRAQADLQRQANSTASAVLADGPAASFDGDSLWDLLPGSDDPANQDFFKMLRGGTFEEAPEAFAPETESEPEAKQAVKRAPSKTGRAAAKKSVLDDYED
ncbi:YbaB/EbfC family nucleoid-associated protein [Streptomyces sp. NPDC000410]|uniref:YbaB/EbfC family nucleoid-associated protein n=1 Tax=Streptomyces sp. NPDC000410 TaxID=3154254 RepID=UPI00331D5430